MAPNPIKIDPGVLMPAAEAAMEEVARLYPLAYKAVFDLSLALEAAAKTRGMVGSKLSEALLDANTIVSNACTQISVSPDRIRTALRQLDMEQ